MKEAYLLFIILVLFSYSIQNNNPPVYSNNFSGLLQMFSNEYDYIDIALLFLPKRVEVNILQMCNEMNQILRENHFTDAMGAFLVYKWIAENIEYDCSSKDSSQRPQYVYSSGKGTSKGISSLFETMCNYLNIQSESIEGLVKSYTNDKKVMKVNDYTWNYVLIEGNYYLVDASMGPGVCEGNVFNNDITDFYFGTYPEIFIRNHLPNESKWQLLVKPISIEQFYSMGILEENFYRLGFKTISPDLYTLDLNKTIKIELTYNASIPDPEFKGLVVDSNENGNIIEFDNCIASKGKAEITFQPKTSDISYLMINAYYHYSIYGEELENEEIINLATYKFKSSPDKILSNQGN